MSISCSSPHSGASIASAACTSTRGSPVRIESGCGSAGGRPGQERAVDEQAPDLLEGDVADEVLDVDAAVAERAAFLVGLGDLGRERDDAFEAGLDLRDGLAVAGAAVLTPIKIRRPRNGTCSLVLPGDVLQDLDHRVGRG